MARPPQERLNNGAMARTPQERLNIFRSGGKDSAERYRKPKEN